jgi:hypothetical protein
VAALEALENDLDALGEADLHGALHVPTLGQTEQEDHLLTVGAGT